MELVTNLDTCIRRVRYAKRRVTIGRRTFRARMHSVIKNMGSPINGRLYDQSELASVLGHSLHPSFAGQDNMGGK